MSLINREDLIAEYDRVHVGAPGGARKLMVDALEVVPEPKWIPCSERLPEDSGRYLISVLDGVGRRTTVAPYQPRYKAWTMTGRMAYWKVIAWMPLPESYKGDKDGE